MAWQYVGGTSGTGTSNGYSVSLNGTLTGGIASSPAAGDIVVVSSGFGNTASSAPAVSGNVSGAYTSLFTPIHQNDTWDTEFGCFYKIMGASVDTSLTITRTTNTAYGGGTAVQVWRGVDQTTPIDVTTTAGGGNASAPNPPSITPTTVGALIMAAGCGTQGASGSAFTVPAGLGYVSILADGSTSDVGVYLRTSIEWASGAYDPSTATGGATSSSCSWAAATIALRPVSATPKTLTTSAAVSDAYTLTAVIGAAVRAGQAATVTVDGAVQVSHSATIGGDSVIAVPTSRQVSLDALITLPANTYLQVALDTAIQAAQSATASLSAAIRRAQTQPVEVGAAVQVPQSQSVTAGSVIASPMSLAALTGGAIQQAHAVAVDAGAAVRDSRTLFAQLDAGIQVSAALASTADALVALPGAVTVTVGAYVDVQFATYHLLLNSPLNQVVTLSSEVSTLGLLASSLPTAIALGVGRVSVLSRLDSQITRYVSDASPLQVTPRAPHT